jgi:hypothetical protein
MPLDVEFPNQVGIGEPLTVNVDGATDVNVKSDISQASSDVDLVQDRGIVDLGEVAGAGLYAVRIDSADSIYTALLTLSISANGALTVESDTAAPHSVNVPSAISWDLLGRFLGGITPNTLWEATQDAATDDPAGNALAAGTTLTICAVSAASGLLYFCAESVEGAALGFGVSILQKLVDIERVSNIITPLEAAVISDFMGAAVVTKELIKFIKNPAAMKKMLAAMEATESAVDVSTPDETTRFAAKAGTGFFDKFLALVEIAEHG